MNLLKVKTVNEMKVILNQAFGDTIVKSEKVEIDHSLGRILAKDVISRRNVPHFNRSVVDGYAVKINDIQGASNGNPGFLAISGEVEMGKETTAVLEQGKTLYVPTGGMVPEGTEAVVMIEYTEGFGDEELAIYKNAGLKENMMHIGDDIKIGECIFSKGQVLRPQDIGVLSALGYLEIEVFQRLKVGIISTGDEVVRPGECPQLGQVIDINTPALKAVTQKYGGVVVFSAYANDQREAIQKTIEEAIEICDIVVLSGGSSMGEKDYTREVIDNLGEVLLHGLAVKPGKPTILGKVNQKPVVGLPGQPVSAIMVFMIILKELMEIFYQNKTLQHMSVEGELMENVHASPGRRTFQTVKIKKTKEKYEVYPTYGKSGMITLLAYSDGYIEISENEEGKNTGDRVEVTLF
ncbi:MAG: molybdopterin molybdotransferase MoeA [Eubacteriaceae bacterium]